MIFTKRRQEMVIQLHYIVIISILIGLFVTSFNGKRPGALLSAMLPLGLFSSLMIWQILSYGGSYDISSFAFGFVMIAALAALGGYLGHIVGRKLFHNSKT